MFNKITFGNFDGNYNYSIKKDIIIKDVNNNEFKLEKNKIYVIDLWNRGCGICLLKFPKFGNLKETFNNISTVEFLALNIYNKEEDILISQKLFNNRNLNFKTYFISSKLAHELQTDLFPTTLVIKNGKIIFKGNIETLSIFNYKYINKKCY